LGETLLQLKKAGKKTVVFVESFDDDSVWTYYLASFFDKIYVPPSALGLSFRGLRVDHPFIRKTLDKLGIFPEFDQRKDYKVAANLFTEEKFTDAHKETYEELLKVFFEQLINDVAKNRDKLAEEVRDLLAGGPYTSKALLDKKLVDGICYRDELYENVLPGEFGYKSKKEMPLLYFHKYTPKVGHLRPYLYGKHQIALISCEGAIHLGKSQSPLQGQSSIGSDTVCAALRAAAKDKKIKAIILRVNSNGGSYTASDIIAREVRKTKEAGKKVVVSMSGMAASGGYYISADADRIVAEPTTITGSIGVWFGKFVMREMWQKVGVTFDSVETTENSKFMSTLHRFSSHDKERMKELMDYIYDDFKSKVSNGRSLSPEQVEQIAQGRLWLGRIAKEKKIVDELGGFSRAIEIAKELAQIPKTDKVKLVVFPRPLTFLQMFSPPRNSEEDTYQGLFVAPFGVSSLIGAVNRIRTLWMISRVITWFMPPFFDAFYETPMNNNVHFRGDEAEITPSLSLVDLPLPK
jgi:protease-4